MKYPFIVIVFIISNGCKNANKFQPENNTSKLDSNVNQFSTVAFDSIHSPIINKDNDTRFNKRTKAIDDIYFGIPESEHFRYFNRQITLGECNYKVKYLAYNNYSLGYKTISGLY